MLNNKITSKEFEVTDWMRELINKKTKKILKINLKNIKLDWRFEKEREHFITHLNCSVIGLEKSLSSSSKNFNETIDLIIHKLNRELTDFKKIRGEKIHRVG